MDSKSDFDNYKTATKVWTVCMSFGLTLGITIYILGILIGVRLDEKLHTDPLFVILGTLTAIFASFYRLILDVKSLEKPKNKDKRQGSKEEKENGI